MKTFLITGASGFIGSNLVHSLIHKTGNYHLLVNRNSNLWRLKEVLSNIQLHRADISDNKKIKSLIKKIEPDYTFHLSSYGVYPKQNNFNSMIMTNVIGTFNLLDSLEKYSESSKMINVGSFFEYGMKLKSIKTSDSLEPNTLYGVSKTAQSLTASYFSQKTKLTINTLRIFGAFGRYESKNRLIPDILLSILKQKKLFISSPKSKRDFIHIDDVISCIIKISNTKLNNEIINVGNGKEYSVEEIIEICRECFTEKIPIHYDLKNQREFDKTNQVCSANISEITKLVNWEPKIPIRDGLIDSYNWFKENIKLYN